MKMINAFIYADDDDVGGIVVIPPKYNRCWGADYMFMDSNSFMGGKDGSGYAQTIDSLQKIYEITQKSTSL